MLALRLYGPKDIRLEEIPVPEINDDEILLKVDAAAVCGTDVRMWQNGQKGVSIWILCARVSSLPCSLARHSTTLALSLSWRAFCR